MELFLLFDLSSSVLARFRVHHICFAEVRSRFLSSSAVLLALPLPPPSSLPSSASFLPRFLSTPYHVSLLFALMQSLNSSASSVPCLLHWFSSSLTQNRICDNLPGMLCHLKTNFQGQTLAYPLYLSRPLFRLPSSLILPLYSRPCQLTFFPSRHLCSTLRRFPD